MRGPHNIEDLRKLARRRLPRGLFALLERGAEDEVTLANNRSAFARIGLKPRTLVDVSQRSQEVTLFGKASKMPVMIGPTGFGGLCAHHGEIMLARAAAAAGVPFVMATVAMTAMERVMEQGGGGTLWFQLFPWPDRKLTHEVVERARAAGFEALVVTTDTPVLGNLEYVLRAGFKLPFRLTWRSAFDLLSHPGWLSRVLLPYLLEGQGRMPRHENYPLELRRRITAASPGMVPTMADSQTWEDLRTIRRLWPRTLIVKGIMDPRDAVLAADHGVDGIVVSNHGGRNLDGAMATIEALPAIVDAVGHRMTVLIDGGFRRGTDVLKALALGARAVLLGRAPLYGLTAGGEAGAAAALAIFREEIDRDMALLGCSSVRELGREFIAGRPS